MSASFTATETLVGMAFTVIEKGSGSLPVAAQESSAECVAPFALGAQHAAVASRGLRGAVVHQSVAVGADALDGAAGLVDAVDSGGGVAGFGRLGDR